MDVMVFEDIDLSFIRTIPALAGVVVLVYGLVWEGA
jgi:energy-converting hydrogenase Eha subunit G